MSLVAPIEDGKLVQNGTSTTEKAKDGSKLDKDSFLQLLVAQMKYQDPLEPTSNTEYISQYAQFSQVESLQSMSNNMDLQRASSLVGQQVYMKTTTAAGETKYICGKVDYVTYEGGQAYLYINENRYPLAELETIVDPDYNEAFNKATDLVTALNKLPAVGGISLSDGEAIDALQKAYDSMNEYQKSFVAKPKAEALKAYTDKIAELRKLAEAQKKEEEKDLATELEKASEKDSSTEPDKASEKNSSTEPEKGTEKDPVTEPEKGTEA